MSTTKAICLRCGKTLTVPAGAPMPFCCGDPMTAEPLPYCTTAPDAEMARAGKADEPCDDGTGRKS